VDEAMAKGMDSPAAKYSEVDLTRFKYRKNNVSMDKQVTHRTEKVV